MRNAVNNLQAIYLTYNKINKENTLYIIDKPDQLIIEDLLNSCIKGDYEESLQIVNKLIYDGYSSLDIIQILFESIKDINIELNKRLKIIDIIGTTQMNLINGGDSHLQLMALVARIINL